MKEREEKTENPAPEADRPAEPVAKKQKFQIEEKVLNYCIFGTSKQPKCLRLWYNVVFVSPNFTESLARLAFCRNAAYFNEFRMFNTNAISIQDGSIRILDALSASGLRALRFSQEVWSN